MNNKITGTEFEREVVTLLSQKGYWVHFITPNATGSQPFDIIASKCNVPIVGDCKTSSTKYFNISRLEENQIMAFELWFKTGNNSAFIFVKYNYQVYQIPYKLLASVKRINLDDMENFII